MRARERMACFDTDVPQPKVNRRQEADCLARSDAHSVKLRSWPSDRRKMLLRPAPDQRQYATRGFSAAMERKFADKQITYMQFHCVFCVNVSVESSSLLSGSEGTAAIIQ